MNDLNPLNFNGPDFLFFYFILSLAVNVLLRVFFRLMESKDIDPPLRKIIDPYKIAYLRGGENEAARVAVVSLADRGLLEVKNDNKGIKSVADISNFSTAKPLEKAVLQRFEGAYFKEGNEIFDDLNVLSACLTYEKEMQELGFVADEKVYLSRLPWTISSIFLTVGLAAGKIIVALERGKTNIIFLILLTILVVWFLWRAQKKERTALGDRVLNDFKNMFVDLKSRSAQFLPSQSSNDAAFLSAIFGMSALPTPVYPYAKKLYPKSSNSWGSGTCGAGCSSACGGGGGCGGGGCGGGCGGCGG